MAIDGIKVDAVAESGRNPMSTRQIQPGCGEWPGWRGTGRPNLFRENKFSGANGGRENICFPCSADHEQDQQPYLVDPYSCCK